MEIRFLNKPYGPFDLDNPLDFDFISGISDLESKINSLQIEYEEASYDFRNLPGYDEYWDEDINDLHKKVLEQENYLSEKEKEKLIGKYKEFNELKSNIRDKKVEKSFRIFFVFFTFQLGFALYFLIFKGYFINLRASIVDLVEYSSQERGGV